MNQSQADLAMKIRITDLRTRNCFISFIWKREISRRKLRTGDLDQWMIPYHNLRFNGPDYLHIIFPCNESIEHIAVASKSMMSSMRTHHQNNRFTRKEVAPDKMKSLVGLSRCTPCAIHISRHNTNLWRRNP